MKPGKKFGLRRKQKANNPGFLPMSGKALPQGGAFLFLTSDIEAEVNHVAFLHQVVLAFQSPFSRLFGA